MLPNNEKFVDTGLNPEYVKRIQANGECIKPYADAHRNYVKRKKNLGFQCRLKSPCSICGHRICRCEDRRRREAMTSQSDIHETKTVIE